MMYGKGQRHNSMSRAINHDPAAIRFRLTAAQMSVIWPGLDIIVMEHVSRREKKRSQYAYPFRLYPFPRGSDIGTDDTPSMNQIIALWKALRTKSAVGGRVQMNAVPVRTAIFAVRVNLGLWRHRKHDGRRWNPETKKRLGVDGESLKQLRIKSQRVLTSLERHMKRANRHLLSLVPPEDYAVLMDAWKKHLRWMRLPLVYFTPLPPVIQDKKYRHQLILDKLGEMA
jgi:hypothetical protein